MDGAADADHDREVALTTSNADVIRPNASAVARNGIASPAE